ncbi:MAG: ECF transporter S component [Clostridia bacterium]
MNKSKVQKMVGMALFAAIVVVLQIIGNYIRIGNFSISLVLIPIIVGAALYGPIGGAFLGGVFGAVVIWDCITVGNILWIANPVVTAIVCMLKGILAGFVSGVLYKYLSGKNKYVGAYVSAVACPLVNTGIFCASLFLFFRDTLAELAGGTNIIYFAFVGMIGVNFLIELLVNIVFAPAVVSILKTVQAGKK